MGDGIRSDLQAIAAHLNGPGTTLARLSLVEMQLWREAAGRVVVLPHIPVRTEVITQRVLLASDGLPLCLEPQAGAEEGAPEVERVIDPAQAEARAEQRASNRRFWSRFVEAATFDHPDQPAPRHGGNNWVKVPLPEPAGWVSVYRTSRDIGAFVRLQGEAGRALYQELAAEADALQAEGGLDLAFAEEAAEPFAGTITAKRPVVGMSEAEQLAWVRDAANRFVTLMRPRLAQWSRAQAA